MRAIMIHGHGSRGPSAGPARRDTEPSALAGGVGEVTVLFGGEGGVRVAAKAGDVIVLPAGTGHKKLSSRGSLGIVGAYPEGAHPETCRSFSKDHLQSIASVPLPAEG